MCSGSAKTLKMNLKFQAMLQNIKTERKRQRNIIDIILTRNARIPKFEIERRRILYVKVYDKCKSIYPNIIKNIILNLLII